ncbi:hypothetical protein [Roseomonas genomospecies 6]|uniref:Uncharacterized protein n=1 Tax=Roseomonas genomospecies 6 TaxID=214106 RepID=A0A9W7KQR2_9PROT|nr:hypothetical protein [Roseomonas genomospecies 6]KAA0677666.1 hypothetical protein DS843_22775 [Roseomonas genomospecies 6]
MPNNKDTSLEVAQMKDRVEAQMGHQRTQIERQATFARAGIAKNEKMKDSNVIRMAKNLYTIITQACTAARVGGGHLTKSAITEAACMGSSNGKSGALERFTRDPLSEEKTRGRLTQKPAGYLKLAEAATKLAGLDSDGVVVALVQGTTLAEGMDALPENSEAEHLVMLSAAIQGQARRIAEATGLPWYYDTIERQGLAPNGNTWEADYESFMWEWQTVPRIELVTEELAVFFGDWWPKKADGTHGEVQRMAVWACRRIGLALAPFGPKREVRAYLVRRPVLAVTYIPKPRREGVPLSLTDLSDFMIDGTFVIGMPDHQGHVFSRHGTLRVSIDDAQAIRTVCHCESSDYPGDDHEFIEVSPTSLASVLDSGFPDARNIHGDALRLPKADVTLSPPGTRAASLERDLRLGQHSDEDGRTLMVRLEERAREYVEGLHSWMYEKAARIEDDLVRMAGGVR